MKVLETSKSKKKVFPAFLAGTFLLVEALLLLSLAPACRLYKLRQQLDPVNAEFLSKVGYIITKEEEKIFLELPDSEREAFKEEFWKRRDPDPYTPENEFQMEYLNRIQKADGLYIGEGKPGWLTDRGRIYILFGPPTDRVTYPMGGDPYSRCREIWYYGNFPVLFIDQTCTGNYVLTTLDLSHLHDLNLALASFQTTFKKEREFFNFTLGLKKIRDEENLVEGMIALDIPYEGIWFSAEGGKLKTVLEMNIEIRDSENVVVWSHHGEYEVALTEEELNEKRKMDHRIEIPFVLTENLDKLRQAKARLHITLKNRTGGEELKKVAEFSI